GFLLLYQTLLPITLCKWNHGAANWNIGLLMTIPCQSELQVQDIDGRTVGQFGQKQNEDGEEAIH
ncbi:unnamed protein product, partial [Urochloa humidicola]